MNLHRTTGKPDWENIKPADYTLDQKIAAATRGFVTPGNLITLIGFGIVIYGLVALLQKYFWLGLILLAVGRLLDILDGFVAEATHTKSPLGETFDAVADKAGTLLTIIVLIVANIAAWWMIVALIIPQLLIPIVIFYKQRAGVRVHPTRPGKLSMATAWVGIVGLIAVKAMETRQALSVGVDVLIIVSLLLSLYALWQYSTGRD